MSADASAFSCLPLAVRDRLLQQAFQQLDQRHLFGVTPRVCRLWHQLSLSIITTSLDVTITIEAAAEQLSLWIKNLGAAGLRILVLHLDQAVCGTPAARSLLQSLGSAMQLRSLDISSTHLPAVLDVPLPPLTNLTSLSIRRCSLNPTVVSSILNLSSLNSLSLMVLDVDALGAAGDYWSSIMEQMVTRLVGLTSLDLGILVSIEGLAHLCALPQLKRLSLGPFCVPATSLRHLDSRLPVTSIYISSRTESLTNAASWLHTAAPGLEHLFLRNLGIATAPASFLPLHKAVHLESLYLGNLRPDFTQLAALTQLTKLTLRNCDMRDSDVCILSALTGLQSLDLLGNPGITGAQESMEVLANSMSHLDSLHVMQTAAQ